MGARNLLSIFALFSVAFLLWSIPKTIGNAHVIDGDTIILNGKRIRLAGIDAPELVVRVFLDRADPGFEAVAALSTSLMAVAALFQVFDGLQAIASRALRGLRDTLVPLWLAGFGYWGLGIGGGSLLAFPLGQGTIEFGGRRARYLGSHLPKPCEVQMRSAVK